MCFFNSTKWAYLEQSEPISSLKTLIGKMYSFQKLNHFSQGNNMLHAPASNTDGFHSRVTGVSSTQLKILFGSKRPTSTLKKSKLQEVFLSKLTQFFQGNTIIDSEAYHIDGSLER
jgi:hypothetical protein